MIKEIKFTDNALKQIANLLSKKDDGSFFRIAIKGGGCSGFQYEFTFEKSKNDDDLNFENILIDKTSADLLKGSEVDYVSELRYIINLRTCLLYTSPSPRDGLLSRMPSSA